VDTDEGTVPMVSGGLSAVGLNRLHEVMAGQVREGRVPGLVLGLRRGGDVHIDAVGSAVTGGSTPMWPDAIFRLTSMTRPVTAVATLLLVQDGRLELDEPIGRLLPELAGRCCASRTARWTTPCPPAARSPSATCSPSGAALA